MQNYSFPKKQIITFSGCICSAPSEQFQPFVGGGEW